MAASCELYLSWTDKNFNVKHKHWSWFRPCQLENRGLVPEWFCSCWCKTKTCLLVLVLAVVMNHCHLCSPLLSPAAMRLSHCSPRPFSDGLVLVQCKCRRGWFETKEWKTGTTTPYKRRTDHTDWKTVQLHIQSCEVMDLPLNIIILKTAPYPMFLLKINKFFRNKAKMLRTLGT